MADEFVPQEQEDEDINPNDGDLIISGLGSFGSLYVSGNSTFADINAGIITASQINASIIGISTLSVGYASTAGIATYASTAGIATYADAAGISTTSQGLTGTPNITVGVITASAYVATGTTAVYAGINTSTIDSNTTSFHYVTFDTTNSGVNISNFISGKKFEILCRNSSIGSRNIIIRSSITTTGHTALPQIVHSAGTITNGTISIAAGSGIHINVFNMNGTIVGSY